MWPNPQFSVDLIKFTEEILNEHFIFCAVYKIFRHDMQVAYSA